jgi:hypothetical protein
MLTCVTPSVIAKMLILTLPSLKPFLQFAGLNCIVVTTWMRSIQKYTFAINIQFVHFPAYRGT